MKLLPLLLPAALVCPLQANPTFVVNAGAGADLVLDSASGTFDSEAVPPSGAANIYAALNGGAFLNTGNDNATLAYSFTVNDGDVLSLHRNSFGVTAASVYGFDLRSGDGTTLLYNGAVDTGNDNTGGVTGPTLATGVPWEVTDPFDGSTWRLTFAAATADSADLVQGTAATPGADADRVDTITFTKVVPPVSAYEIWAAANADEGPADQDFDQDGVANGIEYFMGESGSGFTANPAVVAGKITWPKGASYTGTYGTNHVVQTSPNLIDWTDVPLSGVSDGPSSVEYALVFAPEEPIWFVRLKVIP